MTTPAPCVGDYSEAELISRIGAALGPRISQTELSVGVGDDAAAWDVSVGSVLLSTDMFCENEDFRTDWSTPEDVGFKVVVQNVADIVAMGAACTGLLLSVGLPRTTPLAWFDGFLHGIRTGADTYDVLIAGGDLSAAALIVVNTTSFGHSTRPVVQRNGAKAGDGLWISGNVGRSAAGLWALSEGCSGDRYNDVVRVHRRPEPDLMAALPALSCATAALDVSDGLVKDSTRIAQASDCTVRLDHDVLGPWAETLAASVQVSPECAHEWVYTGGEEHVILATFPDGTDPGAPYTRIGDISEPSVNGPTVVADVGPFGRDGFDHFG